MAVMRPWDKIVTCLALAFLDILRARRSSIRPLLPWVQEGSSYGKFIIYLAVDPGCWTQSVFCQGCVQKVQPWGSDERKVNQVFFVLLSFILKWWTHEQKRVPAQLVRWQSLYASAAFSTNSTFFFSNTITVETCPDISVAGKVNDFGSHPQSRRRRAAAALAVACSGRLLESISSPFPWFPSLSILFRGHKIDHLQCLHLLSAHTERFLLKLF